MSCKPRVGTNSFGYLCLESARKLLHNFNRLTPSPSLCPRVEKSSDQVIKPVNTDALSKWVGFYSEDVLKDMAHLAPMLETLGYDPEANPPNYRQLRTDRGEDADEDLDRDEEDAEGEVRTARTEGRSLRIWIGMRRTPRER